MGQAVAKKKPTANRHKGTFVVRLPEEYRTPIKALALDRRRTISAEITLALDSHIRANPLASK